MKNIQAIIEAAWEARDKVTLKTKGPVRKAVITALAMLDSGEVRVAEKVADRKSTRLNSSHVVTSRMPSSA